MRIAHSHGQARMTQDLLQGQDVPAVLDEVTGEGMPESMGGLPFRKLYGRPGQGSAERGDGRIGLAVLLPVANDLGFQLRRAWH